MRSFSKPVSKKVHRSAANGSPILNLAAYAAIMTEDDRIFLQENWSYCGLTLKAEAALLEALPRLPVCAACPAARWYKVTDKAGVDRLECFCVEFRGTVYSLKREAVTACDARADALDRLKPTRPSIG